VGGHRRAVGHALREPQALEQLHGDERLPRLWVAAPGQHLGDVLALDAGGALGLLEERAADRRVFAQVTVDDLQRAPLAGGGVLRLVDRREPTRIERADDAVVLPEGGSRLEPIHAEGLATPRNRVEDV
jgi:hypothetical protein